jgi:hypothetical protein
MKHKQTEDNAEETDHKLYVDNFPSIFRYTVSDDLANKSFQFLWNCQTKP